MSSKNFLWPFINIRKCLWRHFITYHVSRVPSGLHGGDGNDGGQNKRRHDLRLLVTWCCPLPTDGSPRRKRKLDAVTWRRQPAPADRPAHPTLRHWSDYPGSRDSPAVRQELPGPVLHGRRQLECLPGSERRGQGKNMDRLGILHLEIRARREQKHVQCRYLAKLLHYL